MASALGGPLVGHHNTPALQMIKKSPTLSGRRRQPLSRTIVPMRGMHAICAAKKVQESPFLLKLAVGLVTELLRIFTTSQERSSFVSGSTTPHEVSVADIDDVVAVLESDYKRSYFLTGEFMKSIYAEDCWFIDPTIRFRGRDLYQRNLQLLVPFFVNPSLDLCGIEQGFKGDAKFIKANWYLRTYLKLPWRPLISLEGSTIYDLDDSLKIVYHVESWNISAFEAVTQIFLPSANGSFHK